MPSKHELDEDDTSSVDSESSSSSSESESIADELSPLDEATFLESVVFRQRLLSRLLQNSEDNELAKQLKCNEEFVNKHLLSSLREQLQSQSESKPSVISNSSLSTLDHQNKDQTTFRCIKQSILREVQFTIPGLISLLTHCSLYLSIYGCLNFILDWVCDKGIIYLFGWHISENAFDCTKHEQLFHFVCLLFGCTLGRITGSIWAWNENEDYQYRLKKEMKRRPKRSWDLQLIRWFEGRGEYKNSTWGPRWKLFLDSFSFFIVYIAVDKLFLKDFANYALDTRAVILEGMPSRQLKGGAASLQPVGAGQCTNASDSNTLEECSNAPHEEFVSDIMNWLENNNRCRWIEKEVDEKDGEEDDGAKFRPWTQHDEEWKQLINEKDEKYLIENVSYKTYYELVGDPASQFIDPRRENVFFVVLTLGGFGVLLCMGAPFLLI